MRQPHFNNSLTKNAEMAHAFHCHKEALISPATDFHTHKITLCKLCLPDSRKLNSWNWRLLPAWTYFLVDSFKSLHNQVFESYLNEYKQKVQSIINYFLFNLYFQVDGVNSKASYTQVAWSTWSPLRCPGHGCSWLMARLQMFWIAYTLIHMLNFLSYVRLMLYWLYGFFYICPSVMLFWHGDKENTNTWQQKTLGKSKILSFSFEKSAVLLNFSAWPRVKELSSGHTDMISSTTMLTSAEYCKLFRNKQYYIKASKWVMLYLVLPS